MYDALISYLCRGSERILSISAITLLIISPEAINLCGRMSLPLSSILNDSEASLPINTMAVASSSLGPTVYTLDIALGFVHPLRRLSLKLLDFLILFLRPE